MARVIAIGDAHFQHSSQRNAARIASAEQITTAGLAMSDLGAWIWLGDVFNTRSATEDRMLAADLFQRQAAVAPVLVIYGNHCVPRDLHIFAKLQTKYPVIVSAQPEVVRITLATGESAAIATFPYPHKAGLVVSGAAHDQLAILADEAIDAICLGLAAELKAAQDAGAITMLVGHATIAGAVTSVGQPMGLNGDIAITSQHLSRFGAIPKLFGHIHKPQELHGAIYAGSISANDYGETERKRALVVQFEPLGGYTVEAMPLDTPRLFHVEGELAREGFTWRVTKGLDGPEDEPPASFEGCEVRVRYRYNAAEKSALDEALVRAPFQGAKRVDTDPIAMRSRAVRAPEVAAAATLDAKTQVFVEQSGVEWTPSFATKLALLQQVHADDQAFLAAVRQGLSGVVPDGPAAGQDQESTCADSQAVPDTELQEAL